MGAQAETTGTVRSGDVEIFYRRFGRKGRTPMLIVHGLCSFSYDWISPAARLATDREVAAIDMRGFGNSSWSWTSDYIVETLGADVIRVLDHLEWPRAVLLGHAFGGRVCLTTSGRRENRVAALILVDFAPDIAAAGRQRISEHIGLQPDLFASVADALSHHGHTDVPAGAPLHSRYEAFLRKGDHGYVLRRDLAFRDSFKRVLDAGALPLAPTFLWPVLEELTIPVFVVRARESDMFAPETLDKIRDANPRITATELAGSHDL